MKSCNIKKWIQTKLCKITLKEIKIKPVLKKKKESHGQYQNTTSKFIIAFVTHLS